jgi:nucleoside-diphosphate-sugar epimerase
VTHTLLAVGLGYSAKALAARLKPQGWDIIGTARSAGTHQAIEALGYQAAAFDGTAPSPQLTAAIGAATHLLVSAPPDEDGDPLLLHHLRDLHASHIVWIGYLSTVGVYGDRGGDWVDEEEAPTPVFTRSRQRLAAEQAWEAFAARARIACDIFRLSGIYGPGRGPLERVRAGSAQAITKRDQVFNRIHVDDIATTVEAGIMTAATADAPTTRLFNVTDDEPAPPQDVLAYAAGLIGAPMPEPIAYEDADLSPMARSFYMENKRVSNQRIKDVLGVRLAYPTYREGLQALAQAGE